MLRPSELYTETSREFDISYIFLKTTLECDGFCLGSHVPSAPLRRFIEPSMYQQVTVVTHLVAGETS